LAAVAAPTSPREFLPLRRPCRRRHCAAPAVVAIALPLPSSLRCPCRRCHCTAPAVVATVPPLPLSPLRHHRCHCAAIVACAPSSSPSAHHRRRHCVVTDAPLPLSLVCRRRHWCNVSIITALSLSLPVHHRRRCLCAAIITACAPSSWLLLRECCGSDHCWVAVINAAGALSLSLPVHHRHCLCIVVIAACAPPSWLLLHGCRRCDHRWRAIVIVITGSPSLLVHSRRRRRCAITTIAGVCIVNHTPCIHCPPPNDLRRLHSLTPGVLRQRLWMLEAECHTSKRLGLNVGGAQKYLSPRELPSQYMM
jgi:hypothetical protein